MWLSYCKSSKLRLGSHLPVHLPSHCSTYCYNVNCHATSFRIRLQSETMRQHCGPTAGTTNEEPNSKLQDSTVGRISATALWSYCRRSKRSLVILWCTDATRRTASSWMLLQIATCTPGVLSAAPGQDLQARTLADGLNHGHQRVTTNVPERDRGRTC